MDLNLPLILFLAVAGTGVVWLVDLVFFQKKRSLAIVNLNDQFPELNEEQREQNGAYQEALQKVAAEPALVEYSRSFFPVLLLVFVLRSFIIEPFQIPSESMVPTLEVGDYIAVNKYAYGVRLPLLRNKILEVSDPKRGDVMVFFPPHEDRYFIKRVVGLPGDKIRYTDHVLFINGEKIDQEFLKVEPALRNNEPCARMRASYVVVNEFFDDQSHLMRKCTIPGSLSRDGYWEVPEGHYFMMGDNRDNSSDSRAWGPVSEDRIVGKAFAIWMHWDSMLTLPSFSRVGTI